MATDDERSWSRASVIIAGVGVLTSIVVSLVIAQVTFRDAQEERRQQALSNHLAALTRYSIALDMLSETSWVAQQDVPTPEATLRVTEDGATPYQTAPMVVRDDALLVQAAADAAIDYIVTYDQASWYFSDALEVRECSEVTQLYARRVITLGALRHVSSARHSDQLTARNIIPGKVIDLSSMRLSLSGLGEGVKTLRDAGNDSHVCGLLAQ